MLSLLLSLTLQSDIIGWRCSAERTVEGRTYRLAQSIEGNHRYTREFRVNWMSGPFEVARFIEWLDLDGMPPDAPRTVNFRVPVAGRTSRPLLRIAFPDGTGQLLSNDTARWAISPLPGRVVSFQSLDRGLNRQLWAAGNFRATVEDSRGRALGTLEVSLPDPAEATRIAAELDRAVDEKLRDPANPANQCGGYGEEAYVDPA